MDMITPSKIPETHRRPPSSRVVVPMVILFSVLGVVATLFLPPMLSDAVQSKAAKPEPTLNSANAGELCVRLSENPKDYMSSEALQRRWALRSESCNRAFAEHPENTHFKVAVARAMSYAQRDDKVALLCEAAAQGDAEAYYEIYEHHKSWDRGDLDQVPLVTRAEADRALHKAAELGHPFATQMLAILARPRHHRETRFGRRAILGGTRGRQSGERRQHGRPSGAARTPAGDVRPTGRARPRSRHP